MYVLIIGQGRHAVEIFWGAREMSRPDDGGTEGPERGAGGAKRRSAEADGVWGLCPQKIFQKINVEIAHFQAFLQAQNKMVSSAVSARHIRLGTPY